MRKSKKPAAVATCRMCGCTDEDCRECTAKTGEPCHWVEPDLCSACAIDDDNPDGCTTDNCLQCARVGDILDDVALAHIDTDLLPVSLLPEVWQKKLLAPGNNPAKVFLCMGCQRKFAKDFYGNKPPAEKFYAWDVTVSFNDRHGTEEITLVAPTEVQARRKAGLRPHVKEVVSLKGVTEKNYRLAYGYRRARL